ncbi:PH and SEC7 domain-containing protein C11E3.11c [Colletotrichum chlorophyti]|uniref:PH and SEC7 domain-containing protein C11E3.11c n=1 Tax=Colletotrichum chlorophyti TaxID=708187 RepID=A0A1Q8S432_9PEZI|nr:PH and SEC7 domain-containing protein C11E3.11c [Colletotrichum chlorophyti]
MYADASRRPNRRRPDLNIDTSTPPVAYSRSNVASRDSAAAPVAPKTPPTNRNKSHPSSVAKAKSNSNARALRGPSPSRHADDSFLDPPESPDSFDMSENKENDNPDLPRPRDSHDLSLSPRNVTRDSLMTNMLISLDQFSMGGPVGGQFGSGRANMFDEPTQHFQYDTDGDGMSRSMRGNRGNGHSYSYSSDFDADDSSRISSRGRRSNSSSNFQPGLHRISSMREPLRSSPGTPRHHMHSRGGKGGSTKSSSSNSIDAGYVQVLSSTRWASGFGGRSSSFDYGHRPPPLQATQHQAGAPPWHIEFSNTFFDEYDAAPTPTIPAGPRRIPPPMTPPATSTPLPLEADPLATENVEPPHVALERKRSNRSAKSTSTNRKGDGKPNDVREEVPPMPAPAQEPAASAPVPAFEIDSAPAPHVGYGKTKEAVHGAPIPTHAPSQTKEKPGFFRRVFGSSRNNAANNPPETQNSSGITSSSSMDTVDQRSGNNRALNATSQMKPSTSAPPSRDTSSSHSHHHVLQKRPSSFFRRRKKSVSADEVPPVPVAATLEPPVPPLVPPIHLPVNKDKLSVKPEPSPISSLRRVMNPYLKGSPVTPNAPHNSQPSPLQPADPEMAHDQASVSQDESADEHPRSFSPDYDPSPNARIREVRSESRDEADSQHDCERRTDTPTRPPPEPPMSAEKRNNSFLDIDASDNEADTESRRNRTRKDKTRRSGRTNKDPSPSRRGPSPRNDDDTIRGRKNNRLAVAQADSDDEGSKPGLILPIEGTRSTSRASGSTTTEYKSAVSGTPSVRVEVSENSPKVLGTFESINAKPLDEPDFVVGDPTDDDRQKAQKIFDGNEDFIQKEKAAAWMGEEGPIRQRTLRAYMDLYDFTNKSILQSLRLICERLVFRAETQQVDRILVAFSKRWCDCNTNHGFKASDVIHTICYSIMLLNTDLHLADIDQKMTRSQFVKNTMTTITQAVAESAPDAFERPTILPGKTNSSFGGDDSRPSIEERFTSRRLSFRPPPRHEGDGSSDAHDECGPLVKAPFDGSMRAWESQVEVVLKDIYNSIRDERLPLFGADPSKNLAPNPHSSLSVMGMLKRTPSVLSKAPSESQASMRGRIAENGRANSSRWNSKSRSRPRMGNPGFSSSRTSFEDGNSIWSPTVSSATWSKLSLGRTQTSMSMDSLHSSFRGGDYQQSIGFANALSQAIIRDDDSSLAKAPSIMSDELKPAHLLEDESLELAGPPWVKEGIVIHKHHLDGIDKKAKDRHWNEVFAVVQKGQMSIFSFGANKSVSRKSRGRHAPKGPAIVGGGNWQENATNLGTFSLRQTLASALPPPGYSRARPHVWALSLPTGAVHLFQVGTPEICNEFVTTANYWSARLSTHPLVGGISNIEYGWSDAIINNALVTAINEQTSSQSVMGRPRSNSRPGSSATVHTRASMSSNYRSASLDQGPSGSFSPASRGNKLPGDRIHIAEWAPPTQSMRPSNLPEDEQLDSLIAYVKGIEDELQTHNQLRSPMLLAFTPRGNNAVKAMANWERKSAYLLREIVKFRTYVDCLQQAETRKHEIYTERDLARRAARGELDEGEIEFDIERDTPARN